MPRKNGRLNVVATPIGNLSDLSPRAKKAFSEADLIFCEDTRQTAKLLQVSGIQTEARLQRCDAHQEKRENSGWARYFEEQKQMILVSDAGTPGVSDPGAGLLALAWEMNAQISPIPGPSAVAALLSVAPFVTTPFLFRGFFPRKTSEQMAELDLLKRSKELAPVTVYFESPQRVVESLAVIAKTLPEARVCVGKELTKLHEKLFFGKVTEVSEQVNREVEREGAVGEWSFALDLSPLPELTSIDSDSWQLALECLLKSDVPSSQAVKQISQTFGIAKNTVYEAALKKKV